MAWLKQWLLRIGSVGLVGMPSDIFFGWKWPEKSSLIPHHDTLPVNGLTNGGMVYIHTA